MKYELGLEAVRRDPNTVLTVGSFDGVHKGHQTVLEYVIGRARAMQASSTLLTFDPHPRQVLTGDAMPLLTSVEEKARILSAMGLDRLIVTEFTLEFARMLPEDYVREVLVDRIGLKQIVVGHDHGFGRGRKGTVGLLRQMGQAYGFSVDVLPAHQVGAQVVSSRAIRTVLVQEGNMQAAAAMLTRPYALRGRVVRGAERGRTIGFPTANLALVEPTKVVPRHGVYVVQVGHAGRWLHGMMNIGVRPTVSSQAAVHLEVHLFDFSADLYGEVLEVRFLHRLRDEVKFSSVQALLAQLRRDEAQSRAWLQEMEPLVTSPVFIG